MVFPSAKLKERTQYLAPMKAIRNVGSTVLEYRMESYFFYNSGQYDFVEVLA